MKLCFLFLLFVSVSCAHKDKSLERLNYIDKKLIKEKAGLYHKAILSSEGEYVMSFNTGLAPYISKELSRDDILQLLITLNKTLEIKLTDRGFAKAAERYEDTKQKDETNYDAIWVRDSGWIFFSFVESNDVEKAKKLILALWDYYATPAQQMRFENIIKNPLLARDSMQVPHIRFDGNSKDLKSMYRDGKPEYWNHKQNDAHGIFLLALGQAIEKGIVGTSDFTQERSNVLRMFPAFFDKIKFENFSGAGAWEEVDKINTSSVAMVVKSFEKWLDISNSHSGLFTKTGWDKSKLKNLVDRGYKRIRKNISMGGESPDHDYKSVNYRKEDAALFNIFLPWPLKKFSYQEKQTTLTIMEKLIRPFGVIRYKNDSYQGGNYWLKELQKKEVSGPTLTGDASDKDAFKKRFEKLTPNTEAQWFFDSKLSMIYLHMAKVSRNKRSAEQFKNLSQLYLKRSLGQITGVGQLAADLKPIRPWQVPESINTVIYQGKPYYFASPITPLNWAKASLKMALLRHKESI